jgi:hypothetical protein
MQKQLRDTILHFEGVYESKENKRRIALMDEHNKLMLTDKIPVYFSIPFDWSIIRINLWMKLLKHQLDIEKSKEFIKLASEILVR